jgi:hypothetical protein
MIPPGAAASVTAELAAAAKAAVTQTGDVTSEVCQRVEAGEYDTNAMVDAMARLSSIALAGSLALVKATVTAAQLCAATTPSRLVEHEQTVASASVDRALVVDPPFSRGGTSEVIAPERVTFVPATLPAGQTSFVVRVDATDVPTGLYSGGVRDQTGNLVADVDLLL